MPKQFFTEQDIEDLARRGVTSLEVSDDVVLTELAYERAKKLGIDLGKGSLANPAAPYRPYISQKAQSSTRTPAVPRTEIPPIPARATPPVNPPVPCAFCTGRPGIDPEKLRERVKNAVLARMGSQVDPALIETVIARVMNNIGLKGT